MTETSRFYRIIMWLLRAAGVVALVSSGFAVEGHRPDAFRVTAAAFGAMCLILAVAFVRMGISAGGPAAPSGRCSSCRSP